ncbi:MAG: hypothetical protein FWG10_11655 [Eubacteriaceae bacterium]|nr:hypothetical protein [Eubacteriaceae bacterium]
MDRSNGLDMGGDNMRSVENLSDYIKLLKDYTPSEHFMFRGENAKFEKRLAKAFRTGNNGRFLGAIRGCLVSPQKNRNK